MDLDGMGFIVFIDESLFGMDWNGTDFIVFIDETQVILNGLEWNGFYCFYR